MVMIVKESEKKARGFISITRAVTLSEARMGRRL
jgi:hypothetical protein